MSRTELSGKQVKDGSVQRVDMDVSTSGQAVTTKIVAGDNISLSSTGVDAGTGDVTVSLGGTVAADITALQSADTTLQANIDAEATARASADTALDGRMTTAEGDITSLESSVAGKADSSSLATVATSGDYNDLINTPSGGSGTFSSGLRYESSWTSVTLNSADIFPATSNVTEYTFSHNLGYIPDSIVVWQKTGAGDVSKAPDYFLANSDRQYGFHVKSITTTSLTVVWYRNLTPVTPAEIKVIATYGTGSFSGMTSDASSNLSVSTSLHSKLYTETAVNAFNSALSPSAGSLSVDCSAGNAVLGALDASVTEWAFTNVSTDNSKATTVVAVLDGNSAYTYGDACSVNGSAVTGGVIWAGGSAPTATDNIDMVSFVIVKDSAGTIKVFGSAVTDFS